MAGIPSFSPSIPGLTSGDSSSISSFDTTSSSALTREEETGIPVGRISQAQPRQYERESHRERRRRSSLGLERVAVITSRMGSGSGSNSGSGSGGIPGYRGNTRAERSTTSISHSSWSTAAPSISSIPSQPGTHHTFAENGLEGDIDVDADTDTSRIYTCLFHMLDCHESFDDENHWIIHVLSHFRTHPPPRTARCPLCPNTNFVDGDLSSSSSEDSKVSSFLSEKNEGHENSLEPRDGEGVMRRVDSGTDVREDGPYTGMEIDQEPGNSITPYLENGSDRDGHDLRCSVPDPGPGPEPEPEPEPSSGSGSGSAWRRLLDHVGEHYRSGQTLAGSRSDFELMRYLYGRRIISDAQFKAMQLAPAPSSPAYHASQDGVRASIGSADEPYYAPYSRRREERMRGQQKGVSVGVV